MAASKTFLVINVLISLDVGVHMYKETCDSEARSLGKVRKNGDSWNYTDSDGVPNKCWCQPIVGKKTDIGIKCFPKGCYGDYGLFQPPGSVIGQPWDCTCLPGKDPLIPFFKLFHWKCKEKKYSLDGIECPDKPPYDEYDWCEKLKNRGECAWGMPDYYNMLAYCQRTCNYCNDCDEKAIIKCRLSAMQEIKNKAKDENICKITKKFADCVFKPSRGCAVETRQAIYKEYEIYEKEPYKCASIAEICDAPAQRLCSLAFRKDEDSAEMTLKKDRDSAEICKIAQVYADCLDIPTRGCYYIKRSNRYSFFWKFKRPPYECSLKLPYKAGIVTTNYIITSSGQKAFKKSPISATAPIIL